MPRREALSVGAVLLAGIAPFVAGIGHLGEGNVMGGGVLLAIAFALATTGFFLSPSIRKKWRWGALSAVLSLSVGCVILLSGYLGGRPGTVAASATTAVAQERHLIDTVPAISQTSTGDDSPNIVADGPVTINPPQDPNAPVVFYDPNGAKHTQIGNKFILEDGRRTAFDTIRLLHDSRKWAELAEVCEEEIKATPEWLTPYLYAGVAHANLGDLATARKRLEEFTSRTCTPNASNS